MPNEKSARQVRRELARQKQGEVSLSANLSYSRSEGFNSPFPSANELRQLDDVVPGGAERVLTMIENQNEHRMSMERRAIGGDTGRANLGLAAGFVIALAFLFASYKMIMGGHEIAGGVMGSIDLVSLVSAFIYGSVSRRNERLEKNQQRIRAAESRQRKD